MKRPEWRPSNTFIIADLELSSLMNKMFIVNVQNIFNLIGWEECNIDRILLSVSITAQKINFSTKDFFSKCDQIRSFLRIWSHLLKKSLLENFIFCAVNSTLFVKKTIFNFYDLKKKKKIKHDLLIENHW